MILRTLALILLAAACQPQDRAVPQAPRPAAPSPAPPALAPVASLAGEWRVAGIDGKPLDGQVGIALRADEREIWWDPRCAGFVRTYTIAGTRFSTGPRLGFKPPTPGQPGPPVCLIAPPPQLRDVADALAAGTSIGRTVNNGVEIRGGGRSLLLFSQ